MELAKELLGVATDLGPVPGAHQGLDLLPVLAIQFQAYGKRSTLVEN